MARKSKSKKMKKVISNLGTALPDRLKKNLKLIIIFSIIGIILSLYLTYQHYKEEADPFCQALGGGCELINKSMYSELEGLASLLGMNITLPIPVAIVGLLGFIFNLILAWSLRNKNDLKNKVLLLKLMFAANLLGLLFAIFVTYVEYGILGTPCYYCDASKVSHTIIFIFSAINLKYLKNTK